MDPGKGVTMISYGLVDLPWWGYLAVALVLTHTTIASVTIYLHRHQTHRALDLHPAISHFFRFWLWLTTGMMTKEWVAVHRKHHARVETPEDPHSPQIHGIARLLGAGVFLYVSEARKRDTIERFGQGTPDDWMETHLYAEYPIGGVILMGLVDIVAFGIGPGGLIFGIQMIWIPFWAAGVINGVGHYWGYRNFPVEDASTNIVPWGILIGGEEFHNNHHAYPTSAKLSSAWYEFDIGWMYIRILETLGLARVRRIAPTPRYSPGKMACDADTVKAIVTRRYHVLAQYHRSVRDACRQEIRRLRRHAATPDGGGIDALSARNLLRWLRLHTWDWRVRRPMTLDSLVRKHEVLHTVYSMRRELSELWSRSTASTDQLVKQLSDWRERAESSGIAALREFARRLPHYV
jgi:stearoyl-CoA desaturase (delta-9 desaturase)